MLARYKILVSFSLSLVLVLAGCTSKGLDSILLNPTSQGLVIGQTTQLNVTGVFGATGHTMTQVVTSGVTWTSSAPAVATVSASGLVTAVSTGSATITATAQAFNGPVNADATIVVTTAAASAANGNLVSLTIIPSSITVGNLQDSAQFLAIGTFSTPPLVRDLTNSPAVQWLSSVPNVFPVNTNSGGNYGATAGIVTAYGAGTGTIIAEATGSDGSVQTATATFNCPTPTNPVQPGQCYQGSQAFALLSTLTVYNEGLNTTNWEVTAPSATATPNVVHCGPGWSANGGTGGSVCTATYPLGTSVVLKASGGNFGGWSYNCIPSDPLGNPLNPATISATGPNYCVVSFSQATSTTPANTNITVGAIFN